jgi:hypothetical protein
MKADIVSHRQAHQRDQARAPVYWQLLGVAAARAGATLQAA